MELSIDDFLELAMKGEEALKEGRLREGIDYLEKAIAVGSKEEKFLSAVYNQLGNAYCQLKEYNNSNKFFYFDLAITSHLKDRVGEAKVAANISNVYKLQRDYIRAAQFAEIELNIGTELGNKAIRGSALQHLGSIFLLKGKEAGKNFKNVMSTLSTTVGSHAGKIGTMEDDINKAFSYFNERLKIAEEDGDRQAMGTTYGHLGQCCYVLRNFEEAIVYHNKKLDIAKEFNDKEGQKKSYVSLSNDYYFHGDISKVLECNRLAFALDNDRCGKSLKHGLRRLSNSESELSSRMTRTNINEEEDFFDMITRLQSNRMDEQRCEAPSFDDIMSISSHPRSKEIAIISHSPNESIMSSESKKSHISLITRLSKTLRRAKPLHTSTPIHKHFANNSKM